MSRSRRNGHSEEPPTAQVANYDHKKIENSLKIIEIVQTTALRYVLPIVALSLLLKSHYIEIIAPVVVLNLVVLFRKRLVQLARSMFGRNKQPEVEPPEQDSENSPGNSSDISQPSADSPRDVKKHEPGDTATVVVDRLQHLYPELSLLTEQQRTLSRFSRKRIQNKLLTVKIDTFICEYRLPKSEFWVNLDVGKEHHRLIYGPLMIGLLGLCALVFAATSPLIVAGVPDMARIALALLSLPCFLVFWARYESVAFKRLVLMENHIVFIDSPPLFSGGGMPVFELRHINKVSSMTINPSLNKENSRHSMKAILMSSVASKLGLEWVSADTEVQHDAPLNWFGPYRACALFVALLNKQKDHAKLAYVQLQQGAEEDVKDTRRAQRRKD